MLRLAVLVVVVALCQAAAAAAAAAADTSMRRACLVRRRIDDANRVVAHSTLDATVQRKFEKMSRSAFMFFRGTAHLHWADARGGREGTREHYVDADARTVVSGDQHVMNFGVFHNADDEQVFSVNDFDEAVFAGYEFDVERTAVSLILAVTENIDVLKLVGLLPRAFSRFSRRVSDCPSAMVSSSNAVLYAKRAFAICQFDANLSLETL
jgi:hypothetical protein